MASCSVGSRASDLIKHSPLELFPTYTQSKQKPQEQKGDDDDDEEEEDKRRPRHRDTPTGKTVVAKNADKAKLYDEMYATFLSDWEIEPGQLLYITQT